MQRDYLKFYSRRFPGAKVRKPFVLEEHPGANACTVKEAYLLPDLWHLNEKEKQYSLTLMPDELEGALGQVHSSSRDDPLAVDHPVDLTEEIIAIMFQSWHLTASSSPVANEFFRFTERTEGQGKRLRFAYSYRTLTDRVPADKIADYNRAISDIRDTLGYTLGYRTPAQLGQWSGLANFNWLVAAALLPFLGVITLLAGFFFFLSKRASPLPPPLEPALQGIGGWLILPLLGLIIRPFSYLWAMLQLIPSVFVSKTWRSLTDGASPQFDAQWAPALLFELFYNSFALILTFLVLALFFARRAWWPRLFIGLLILDAIAILTDLIFAMNLPVDPGVVTGARALLVGAVVGAAIWIPYVLVSRRVKATFRF